VKILKEARKQKKERSKRPPDQARVGIIQRLGGAKGGGMVGTTNEGVSHQGNKKYKKPVGAVMQGERPWLKGTTWKGLQTQTTGQKKKPCPSGIGKGKNEKNRKKNRARRGRSALKRSKTGLENAQRDGETIAHNRRGCRSKGNPEPQGA